MPKKKLKRGDAERIKYLVTQNGLSRSQVARMFGITHSYVSKLIKGTDKRRAALKLTDEQVDEIRERYESEPVSTRMLGREYGVSNTHISRIINGKRRKGCTD